jgi:glycosyltransferase involved in cell wall biosynthesis
MGSNARITVGVPVFRGEAYVAQALESIRHQTYHDFEVLVSIDASDEASASICRKFEVDQRFRIFVQPERLQWTGNLNWLIDHTDTEYFLYLAQDDRLHPAYLETLVAEADNHTNAPVVYSDIQWFGRREAVLREPSITGSSCERVMHQLKYCHWTAFRGLRRMNVLRQIEPLIADSYYYFFEDVQWVTKVLNIGEIIRVPIPLLYKRNHSNAVSANWSRWEKSRLQSAWIAAWSRVLSAALPAAKYPGEASNMLRIMVERTALDAGDRDWIARISHLTLRERRQLVIDFIAHLEEESIRLPESMECSWSDIRRFALSCITPDLRRQFRAFKRRRRAMRRNR